MELVPLPPPKPKLTTILSESRRLIKSQPRRFLALFFALLFPLAVSSAISGVSFFTSAADNDGGPAGSALPVWKDVALFLIAQEIFSLFAAISITSVAIRSYHGEPVRLKSVAKSISASFLPLLGTTLFKYAIILAVFFGLAVLCGLVTFSVVFLGFQTKLSEPYLQRIIVAAVTVLTVSVTAYLDVIWALVTPVVVAESRWGFKALKRSASLVKGKRIIAFALILIFLVLYSVVDLGSKYTFPVAGRGDDSGEEKNFAVAVLLFAAQVAVVSSLRTVVRLYETVAKTLLYVFCEAIHDDDIGKDFSGDSLYVRLAVDDSAKVANTGAVISHGKVDGYSQV